jgi:hypothetical protein
MFFEVFGNVLQDFRFFSHILIVSILHELDVVIRGIFLFTFSDFFPKDFVVVEACSL